VTKEKQKNNKVLCNYKRFITSNKIWIYYSSTMVGTEIREYRVTH